MGRTVTICGVKIEVDHPLISPNVREALTSGRYESKEARQLIKMIKPGERVLEVGGGLGLLSSVAAKTGQTESITVVEAHPGMIDLIRRTHEINGIAGTATVIHAAVVGDAGDGTRSFSMRNDFWASAAVPDDPAQARGAGKLVQVPARTLADLVTEYRPTFIVMDIEGGEVEALRGTPLLGVRKMLVEIHPNVIGPAGVNHIFTYLMKRRFTYDANFSHGQILGFRRASKALAAATGAAG